MANVCYRPDSLPLYFTAGNNSRTDFKMFNIYPVYRDHSAMIIS